MTFGTLYGNVSESNGLYGIGQPIPGSTYFQWFIFIESAGAPATPTGGSWNFDTNIGTPPVGWSATSPAIPTLPIWFSTGFVDSRNPTVITWSAASMISSATSVYATMFADTFTGNGTQTTWTLTASPVAINNINVSINGVVQVPSVDYIFSGNTLVTTSAVLLGAVMLVKYSQALYATPDAANINFVPTGYITANNVQAAVVQVANHTTFADNVFAIYDSVDPTKIAQFEVSGVAAGVTRTYTVPNTSGTIALLSGTQTFSGATTFSNTATFSGATATFGSSTAAATYSLGSGATVIGATKAINIGTNGVNGSTTNIDIGPTAAGSIAAIKVQGVTVGRGSGNAAGNTVLGLNALRVNVTGGSNIAVGNESLYNNNNGTQNLAIGYQALYGNISGTSNTVVGNLAGTATTASIANTFVGTSSGSLMTGSYNTIFGGFTGYVAGVLDVRTLSGAVVISDGNGNPQIYCNGNNTITYGSFKHDGFVTTSTASPTIASGPTITPTKSITFISGTSAIATITAISANLNYGTSLTLIPTGVFTWTTAGNIALAGTAVVGKALTMTYDGTTAKWYPSYIA